MNEDAPRPGGTGNVPINHAADSVANAIVNNDVANTSMRNGIRRSLSGSSDGSSTILAPSPKWPSTPRPGGMSNATLPTPPVTPDPFMSMTCQ